MLTDIMGSDTSIVKCARMSTGRGNKTPKEDEHLLRRLMRDRHTSPFEQAVLQFVVYVPMDTWRQWVRHRTASINEYSTRYTTAIDQMYKVESWRKQSKSNKQGSEGGFDRTVQKELSDSEETLHHACRDVYDRRIKMGVSREQARKDLPLSTFTKACWTINLHNLLHFLELRLAQDAQQEIREYAEAIAHIVKMLFPWTWKAFEDYRLKAITLSSVEIPMLQLAIVKKALETNRASMSESCYEKALLDLNKMFAKIEPEGWVGSTEQGEFFRKLKLLMPEIEVSNGASS